MDTLFQSLERLRTRPEPFEHYSSPRLWNDPHISKGMLDAHLDQSHDAGSYRQASIDTSIDWVASQFGLTEQTRVCDLGCGPGLWTTRFARRGAAVTGVDLSERSLRYARDTARQHGLAIDYRLQDYLTGTIEGRFDLVTMIHGDFSVLSPPQRSTLLDRVRELLAPGGRALIEAFTTTRFREADDSITCQFVPAGGYWSPGPHHVFLHNHKYEAESLLCEKYTVVEQARDFEIFVWTQCYSVETLAEVFHRSGLRIESWHADMAGTELRDDSPLMMVVATAA